MKPPKIELDANTLQTRAGLSRAITMIESTRADHRKRARDLLNAVMPQTGESHRIGITGVPGVGKSTFIESFGSMLTSLGKKVAVLTIDPTSSRTGGSILGDKTRMERLSMDPNAYIRPSPAGTSLGGVARRTRETMLLCEAAGYDVIIVETVGVGQSETLVCGMVDVFLVLMLPNAGDELQGIKRGLLELADIIAVNKADIDPDATRRAVNQYKSALAFLDGASDDWSTRILSMSGLAETGLKELWSCIENHGHFQRSKGAWDKKRQHQNLEWMTALFQDGLAHKLETSATIQHRQAELRRLVADNQIAPGHAAEELVNLVLDTNRHADA